MGKLMLVTRLINGLPHIPCTRRNSCSKPKQQWHILGFSEWELDPKLKEKYLHDQNSISWLLMFHYIITTKFKSFAIFPGLIGPAPVKTNETIKVVLAG